MAALQDVPQVDLPSRQSGTASGGLAIGPPQPFHRSAVSSMCFAKDGGTLFTVSQDSLLKIHGPPTTDGGAWQQRRSVPVGELALSSCACTDDGRAVAVGSWDNCIYFYSIECGMPRDGGVAAHDDAVSSLSLRGDKMLSGSWDSTVKVRIHTSVVFVCTRVCGPRAAAHTCLRDAQCLVWGRVDY